ncbi:hypothetical protein K0U00_50610, partial [Paenibacillus sepulcri]|nr:hypothetical protein [Paenibacillus sepulcri]
IDLIRELHSKADEALSRTPDQLPVLKQVGVVDSGGQGLVYIYEGFLDALAEQTKDNDFQRIRSDYYEVQRPAAPVLQKQQPASAQSRLSTETIELLYDMEFFINR